MGWFDTLRLRLRSLFMPRRVEYDADREVPFHLDRQTQEDVEADTPPGEARPAAVRAMGSLVHIHEQCRDVRGLTLLEDAWRDVLYACRMLLGSPALTLTIVLTMGVGIGAITAIFSVLDAVLLQPLPYPDSGRIVVFRTAFQPGSEFAASQAKFNFWSQPSNAFQQVTAYRYSAVNLTGVDRPEQIQRAQATASYFPLLGINVERGRVFTDQEDQPNAGRVVVISHGLWRRAFGGDPEAVGRTISLGGEVHVIVGVTSLTTQVDSGPSIDAWTPLQIDPNSADHNGYLTVVGRLKRDVPFKTAVTQLRAATDEFRRRFPNALASNNVFDIEPLQDFVVGDVRSSLWMLSGAVVLVLLIACANVANLLLVRAIHRRREIAIRTAIGAGRRRIVRQLLTESMLFSALGGLLGLGLGQVGIRALVAFNPGNLPRIGDNAAIALNLHVLSFTMIASMITGVMFGLIPALQASHVQLTTALKEHEGHSTGVRQHRIRSLLVVSEISVALILLTGAGLLIRTFVALRSVKPGFDSHRVLTLGMSLTDQRYANAAGVQALVRDTIARIETLSGVEAAAFSTALPLAGALGSPFWIPGRTFEGPSLGTVRIVAASSRYFSALKIPVRSGRVFTDSDIGGAPRVIVISQTLARQYWKGSDPSREALVLGNRGNNPNPTVLQIVGVAGDVHDEGLDQDPARTVYVPLAQTGTGFIANAVRFPVYWIVRTAVDEASLRRAIQNEIEKTSGLPVAAIRPMEDIISRSTARRSFNMILLTIFGSSALLLAVIGIYGLVTYSVQQRRREMGIRMALGAEYRTVRNMVLSQGIRLACLGVVIGLAAALALTRLVTSLLFGVPPRDPFVFIAAPALLLSATLLAAWIPALRTSRLLLAEVLRQE